MVSAVTFALRAQSQGREVGGRDILLIFPSNGGGFL